MNLPIYDLIINQDENNDAEVSFVALVDTPAIKKDFLAFNEEEEFLACPVATQDIKVNLKNRENAIIVGNYGPANPSLPNNQYWIDKGKIFGGTPEEAKTMTCNNCAAFIRSKEILDCIAQGLGPDPLDTIEAGDLGYCEIFDFKCASSRTCDAWVANSFKKKKKKEDAYSDKVTFAIQSESEHIITGPLMIPQQLIYRNSEQFGEHYVKFSVETIKQIAIKFSKKGYQKNVNLMHEADMKVDGLTMFESFISDSKRGIKPMEAFKDLPDGTWFGSFYVENPKVWQMVKEGQVKGFSVEGMFDYEEPVSEDKKQLEKLREILNSF
jgi:hypothetical protein